jgi:methylated-DNA-[protein]-cysteine S-methyltransferase
MTLSLMMFDAPFGRLALCARGDQLVCLNLPNHPVPDGRVEKTPVLAATAAQLREYFAGTRTTFDLPLAPEGTPFQKLVWDQLLEIPYGVTRSYGEVARAIGRPAASRAVGAANGKNPIAIIIPCHRVIGADGTLTGYGGGMPTKQWLLEHEQRGRPKPRSRRSSTLELPL